MALSEKPQLCATHLIGDDGQLLGETEIRRFLLSSLNAPGAVSAALSSSEKCRGDDDNGDNDLSLRTVGVQYHVVGVFGGQSSGKSTLLNHLFGTDFQTMDETQRRGQTTKGAFMARMPPAICSVEDTPPLFVLDFEGTDGIERGEDQNFERQLSLFALSVADTLIINMWAVDVGRFNAANMSLLRTIFEVNLQLFAHESYAREEKPTLLIVLRDFTDADPSHHIKTIRDSFDMIWKSIVRPEAFRESSIDTLFELRYRCLPHYKLQRADFDGAIVDFRSWFIAPSCERYLFSDRAFMFRGVPLDGLPVYLENCWSVICQSKDLDIPTQRQMLARHRCLELRRAAVARFAETCRGFSERLERGELVPHLSAALEQEVDEALQDFHTQTRLYAPHVATESLLELEEDLVTAEMHLLEQYAKTIAAVVVASLDASVGNAVDGAVRWLVREAQAIPLVPALTGASDFEASEALPPGGDQSAVRSTTGPPVAALVPDKDKCRALVQEFWARVCEALKSVMETLTARHTHDRLFGRFAALVDGDPTMHAAVAQEAMEVVCQKVRHRFASMAENVSDTAHYAFEQALTHAKDGTVRFFATAKGLQKAEPLARQAGLGLLGCLLYYRLRLARDEAKKEKEKEKEKKKEEEPVSETHRTPTPSQIHCKDEKGYNNNNDNEEKCKSRADSRLACSAPKLSVRANSAEQRFFLEFPSLVEMPIYPSDVPVAGAHCDSCVDSECVMLSEQAVQRAFDLFSQKSEFTMRLHLRNIESGRQNLPVWVLPALLVLGWNEIWYVITSPMLLFILILIAVIFFKHHISAQWEVFEESGPAWAVLAIRTVMQYVQTAWNSVMPAPINAQDGPAQTVAASERYRDPMDSNDLSANEAGDATTSSTLRRRRAKID